jgi:hypothetical protein
MHKAAVAVNGLISQELLCIQEKVSILAKSTVIFCLVSVRMYQMLDAARKVCYTEFNRILYADCTAKKNQRTNGKRADKSSANSAEPIRFSRKCVNIPESKMRAHSAEKMSEQHENRRKSYETQTDMSGSISAGSELHRSRVSRGNRAAAQRL